MGVGANGLADLEKDSVSRSGAFPTRLLFASVKRARVELIELLCFARSNRLVLAI